MDGNAICKINHITKHFPGVVALDNINFEIMRGEIHAIVGENGAGKSTLMNVLSGVYPADEGNFEFEGRETKFKEPKDAQDAGIAMIHQELSLSPHMTAYENIFEGRMLKNKFGFIDRKKMAAECKNYLENLGADYINPKSLVKNLSVSEMQLLEIAKAISLNSKMLIMDEPSSSLTNTEIIFMIKIIRKLKDEGVSILYISHKLEEVMEIADRITVLRDGQYIDTKDKKDIDINTMISMMVGRNFDQTAHRDFIQDYSGMKPILEVENLSDYNGKVKDVSFQLYKGEVLGLTGLVGAGRTELLQTIFGAAKAKTGTIKINGEVVNINSTLKAIKLGMGLIPEGRKTQGLFLKMSVKDNMMSVYAKKVSNALNFINVKKANAIANEYVGKLNIKTPGLNQNIDNLSGGNQQKAIVARWLMNNPSILFMDEPTHGIDVGAKSEIYRIIDDLSKAGVSVILLSSELPEVLSMCDRIMIMHHGELRVTLGHKEADQVKIMEYTLEKKAEGESA